MSSSSLGEEGASDYPVNVWTEAIMLAVPLQLAILTVLSVIASQLRLNYWAPELMSLRQRARLPLNTRTMKTNETNIDT